jgi:hypothetical protein
MIRTDLDVMFILFSVRETRRNPISWFTHPGDEKQQSARAENEFGRDCMLGKLCRLEKRCGRPARHFDAGN